MKWLHLNSKYHSTSNHYNIIQKGLHWCDLRYDWLLLAVCYVSYPNISDNIQLKFRAFGFIDSSYRPGHINNNKLWIVQWIRVQWYHLFKNTIYLFFDFAFEKKKTKIFFESYQMTFYRKQSCLASKSIPIIIIKNISRISISVLSPIQIIFVNFHFECQIVKKRSLHSCYGRRKERWTESKMQNEFK